MDRVDISIVDGSGRILLTSDTVVLSHPDAAHLASTIPGYLPMSWDTFPDRSPNLWFPAERLRGKHVVFFMSCDRADTMMEQLA
mgnify:CR=1 FL=1